MKTIDYIFNNPPKSNPNSIRHAAKRPVVRCHGLDYLESHFVRVPVEYEPTKGRPRISAATCDAMAYQVYACDVAIDAVASFWGVTGTTVRRAIERSEAYSENDCHS